MEQVLRSVRRWLRSGYSWCPQEVRIRNDEGTFVRPSLVITASQSTHEPMLQQIDREVHTLTITFYPKEGDDTLDEAWDMSTRLTSALREAQDVPAKCMRVMDFAPDGTVTATDAYLMPEGVSARTFRDEVGVGMTVVDFRVSTLRFFGVDDGPAVTGIVLTDPTIANAELTDITWQ